VETLRQLIDQLQAGAGSDVVSMHAIAHKMHGAGATLDFPAVSQHAAEIERISQQLLQTDPAGAPRKSEGSDVSRLRSSLQQLEQAILTAASAEAFRSAP
jgi:HPt (histidine-containing phosphotransfer) domain-containing protein